jgi:hypothetical protein
MGGKKHKVDPKSNLDSTSGDGYLLGLPEYKPEWKQATNDNSQGFVASLLDSDAPSRDYSIPHPIAGYDTNLSGTSSDTISSSLGGLRGDDISKDVAEIKPYKAKLTKSLDDDITSSFGNNFIMPRIEGIDDVEEKPPKKSDVQFIEGGLLGTGKKDFNDQADDILADTFDVEQRAQEER